MHVALVRRVAVEHVGGERGAPALGGHEGHRQRPEPHAAPFPGHVGSPESGGAGLLAQAPEGRTPGLGVAAAAERLDGGIDLVLDEVPHALAHLPDLRRKGEINRHGVSPLPDRGLASRF